MRHRIAIRVGPIGFRVGSAWREPIAAMERLYGDYPRPGVPEFTIRLEPASRVRRWIRPSVAISGDYWLPEAAPLPLAQGLLAAEMGMNLQVALGCRRFLLLHAGVVERGGRALILSGESGSGKSTLAALLSTQRWRLLADEFALIEPATGLVHPFPRPVSLKNDSIALLGAVAEQTRFGPVLAGTPKGDIRHLIPDAAALARMDEPAVPALLLFPRFGAAAAARPVGAGEVFVRLTQASTNYVALGQPAFEALVRLTRATPAYATDYPDTTTALAQIEALWR
jgi:HprK-related kinase A